MLQLHSGVFRFDRHKGMTLYDDQTDEKSVTSTDPYQAYMVAPIVKGGFKYISMGLVYKPAIVRPGCTAKCKMFLDSFFSSCGDLPDMEAWEIYLLRKCRGVGPLSHPLPTWAHLNFIIPNPGVRNPQIHPVTPVYDSSSLTFQLMTAGEHYLIGTREVANIFIPLKFSREGDDRSHWQRTSLSWHNGMCGWVQLVSEHIVAHHSEVYENLSHTTISTVPHSLIETVAPPSFGSLSSLSSATSMAHAGNPMNTCHGLGSA